MAFFWFCSSTNSFLDRYILSLCLLPVTVGSLQHFTRPKDIYLCLVNW